MPKSRHAWIKRSGNKQFYPVKIITEDKLNNVLVRVVDGTNLTLIVPKEDLIFKLSFDDVNQVNE